MAYSEHNMIVPMAMTSQYISSSTPISPMANDQRYSMLEMAYRIYRPPERRICYLPKKDVVSWPLREALCLQH
jgi:hypothetical protein